MTLSLAHRRPLLLPQLSGCRPHGMEHMSHVLLRAALQEMQKKLRDEYLGLGGSPNTPMGANYFLYIILGISFLAVLSWLSGAI